MMSAFAELEANLLSERTKKVLHLQEQGDAGGRPPMPDHKKEKLSFYMMNKNDWRTNSRSYWRK